MCFLPLDVGMFFIPSAQNGGGYGRCCGEHSVTTMFDEAAGNGWHGCLVKRKFPGAGHSADGRMLRVVPIYYYFSVGSDRREVICEHVT